MNIHSMYRASNATFSALLACALLALAAIMPAQAQLLPGQPGLQLHFPAESPGVPAYARLHVIEGVHDLPNNGVWAALVFYRDPDCIPPNFDLTEFFDLPGPAGLGAFSCPVLIEGTELWENSPGTDEAPIYTRARNATPSLPVWFMALGEIEPLLDRGFVFIDEIIGLPSLIRGSARWYEEALYPGGAAPDPAITLRAEGRLETGGRFRLDWHLQSSTGERDGVIQLELPVPPGPPPGRPPFCQQHPLLPFC